MGRRKPIPDEKRSGFGLGWLYAERGRPLDSNPCEKGTLRYKEFTGGWNEYFKKRRMKGSKRSASMPDKRRRSDG